MSLQDRLNEDLKAAMRGGDTVARETLRMALAAAKNRRIEKGEDLTDADLQAVIEKEVKKRQDAASQYSDAGRPELAEKEQAEAKVLTGYLPEKLDEAATQALLEKLIAELGVSSKKEMGKLMKALSTDYKGQVDMKLAQGLIGKLLSA